MVLDSLFILFSVALFLKLLGALSLRFGLSHQLLAWRLIVSVRGDS